MTGGELFLAQLAVIERVIAWVCARRGLYGADAEDFGSAVKLRLIENDYEVLGKFEGRSSLKTFLTAVVSRLYLDFQIQRFGKWRPSAAARRLGPTAEKLERLMHRDGLSFDEACAVLQGDPGVMASREGLRALRDTLPDRLPRGLRAADLEPPRPASGAAAVERAERQALAERTFATVRCTIAQLPARERLFLRLHLESGFTVAEAARALGHDQKALYRKREHVLKRLRRSLEAEGIRAADAHELLSTLDWATALGLDAVPGPGLGRRGPASVSRTWPGRRLGG